MFTPKWQEHYWQKKVRKRLSIVFVRSVVERASVSGALPPQRCLRVQLKVNRYLRRSGGMVDTYVSGAYGEICAGSSPAFGIYLIIRRLQLGLITRCFRAIGFQDSLDAFILAMMPSCCQFEAYLQSRDLPDFSCTFVLIFALFCTNICGFQCFSCLKVPIYLNIYPVQNSAIKCKNYLSFSLICVKMSLRLRFRT